MEWIKLLANDACKKILIDAIKFYQENREITVLANCIMPNPVHRMVRAEGSYSVSGFLWDLKKFTSRAFVKKLEEEKPEGYRQILYRFEGAGMKLKRIKEYKVRQDGNHAELLYSSKFLHQKLNYIHQNPVRYGLFELASDYPYSSAANYVGKKSALEVVLISG